VSTPRADGSLMHRIISIVLIADTIHPRSLIELTSCVLTKGSCILDRTIFLPIAHDRSLVDNYADLSRGEVSPSPRPPSPPRVAFPLTALTVQLPGTAIRAMSLLLEYLRLGDRRPRIWYEQQRDR
jgi:hypothetical protein